MRTPENTMNNATAQANFAIINHGRLTGGDCPLWLGKLQIKSSVRQMQLTLGIGLTIPGLGGIGTRSGRVPGDPAYLFGLQGT
jgi:hypothetical protein